MGWQLPGWPLMLALFVSALAHLDQDKALGTVCSLEVTDEAFQYCQQSFSVLGETTEPGFMECCISFGMKWCFRRRTRHFGCSGDLEPIEISCSDYESSCQELPEYKDIMNTVSEETPSHQEIRLISNRAPKFEATGRVCSPEITDEALQYCHLSFTALGESIEPVFMRCCISFGTQWCFHRRTENFGCLGELEPVETSCSIYEIQCQELPEYKDVLSTVIEENSGRQVILLNSNRSPKSEGNETSHIGPEYITVGKPNSTDHEREHGGLNGTRLSKSAWLFEGSNLSDHENDGDNHLSRDRTGHPTHDLLGATDNITSKSNHTGSAADYTPYGYGSNSSRSSRTFVSFVLPMDDSGVKTNNETFFDPRPLANSTSSINGTIGLSPKDSRNGSNLVNSSETKNSSNSGEPALSGGNGTATNRTARNEYELHVTSKNSSNDLTCITNKTCGESNTKFNHTGIEKNESRLQRLRDLEGNSSVHNESSHKAIHKVHGNEITSELKPLNHTNGTQGNSENVTLTEERAGRSWNLTGNFTGANTSEAFKHYSENATRDARLVHDGLNGTLLANSTYNHKNQSHHSSEGNFDIGRINSTSNKTRSSRLLPQQHLHPGNVSYNSSSNHTERSGDFLINPLNDSHVLRSSNESRSEIVYQEHENLTDVKSGANTSEVVKHNSENATRGARLVHEGLNLTQLANSSYNHENQSHNRSAEDFNIRRPNSSNNETRSSRLLPQQGLHLGNSSNDTASNHTERFGLEFLINLLNDSHVSKSSNVSKATNDSRSEIAHHEHENVTVIQPEHNATLNNRSTTFSRQLKPGNATHNSSNRLSRDWEEFDVWVIKEVDNSSTFEPSHNGTRDDRSLNISTLLEPKNSTFNSSHRLSRDWEEIDVWVIEEVHNSSTSESSHNGTRDDRSLNISTRLESRNITYNSSHRLSRDWEEIDVWVIEVVDNSSSSGSNSSNFGPTNFTNSRQSRHGSNITLLPVPSDSLEISTGNRSERFVIVKEYVRVSNPDSGLNISKNETDHPISGQNKTNLQSAEDPSTSTIKKSPDSLENGTNNREERWLESNTSQVNKSSNVSSVGVHNGTSDNLISSRVSRKNYGLGNDSHLHVNTTDSNSSLVSVGRNNSDLESREGRALLEASGSYYTIHLSNEDIQDLLDSASNLITLVNTECNGDSQRGITAVLMRIVGKICSSSDEACASRRRPRQNEGNLWPNWLVNLFPTTTHKPATDSSTNQTNTSSSHASSSLFPGFDFNYRNMSNLGFSFPRPNLEMRNFSTFLTGRKLSHNYSDFNETDNVYHVNTNSSERAVNSSRSNPNTWSSYSEDNKGNKSLPHPNNTLILERNISSSSVKLNESSLQDTRTGRSLPSRSHSVELDAEDTEEMLDSALNLLSLLTTDCTAAAQHDVTSALMRIVSKICSGPEDPCASRRRSRQNDAANWTNWLGGWMSTTSTQPTPAMGTTASTNNNATFIFPGMQYFIHNLSSNFSGRPNTFDTNFGALNRTSFNFSLPSGLAGMVNAMEHKVSSLPGHDSVGPDEGNFKSTSQPSSNDLDFIYNGNSNLRCLTYVLVSCVLIMLRL